MSALPRGAAVTVEIGSCLRCGGIHPGLEFKPLSNAADEWKWWAMCPTVREPVMCQLAPEEALNQGRTLPNRKTR